MRVGGPADAPFAAEVDRAVRGAAHGDDLLAMLASGNTLLVALAHVASEGCEAFVSWLTERQQWAVDVCLEARLDLRSDAGCVFLGGDVGSFHPYLPSGAYL